MGTIVIADIYGLGGFTLAPGMLTLAEKIKRRDSRFMVLGPYERNDWEQAAADLAKRPQGDLIAVIGYSLGANNAVRIARQLARTINYLVGIQASYWGPGVDWSGTIKLPANIGRALSIYNPNFVSTFGLGYARFAAPPAFTGSVRLLPNHDLHFDVDNDAGVHGLILRDLQRLAG